MLSDVRPDPVLFQPSLMGLEDEEMGLNVFFFKLQITRRGWEGIVDFFETAIFC